MRYPKTKTCDFTFEFSGYGHYMVTYTSPTTGKCWAKTINNMCLVDSVMNEENPTQKALDDLKRACKN